MSSKFKNSDPVSNKFDTIKEDENKLVKDNLSQTDDISFQDKSIQSVRSKPVKTQTESEIEEDIRLYEDDSEELIRFMRRVGPAVLKELGTNESSHAYSNFVEPIEEKTEKIKVHANFDYAIMMDAKMQVASLSWNYTGSLLAVCYKSGDHRDWCTEHKSAIVIWTLNKKRSECDVLSESDVCFSAVRFHPTKPSILASANFHGEIAVWDTRDEARPCIATSTFTYSARVHREPVNALCWVLDHKRKAYNVISCGFDGTIMVWRVNQKKKNLQILQKYALTTRDLPAKIRARSDLPQPVAITCMSAGNLENDTYLVGAESGGVFRCFVEVAVHPDEKEPESPVKVPYTPHDLSVLDIDLSPFHRNLYLSCSADQMVKISSLMETNHVILKIEPCLSCTEHVTLSRWSPQRPMLLVVGTNTGRILFYDLLASSTKPSLVVSESAGAAITSVMFNPKIKTFMAVGDTTGSVKIYSLDLSICEMKANELDSLDELFKNG